MKNIFGYIGVLGILIAYAGSSFGFIGHTSVAYYLLNLFGSIGIIVSAFSHRDTPSIFLNIIWALIALFSLLKF